MAEGPGEPNARSRIELIEADGPIWRYRLLPQTGRKHQLRVHMAMLGAPIVGDDLYPQLRQRPADAAEAPLQLLAQAWPSMTRWTGRGGSSAAGARLRLPPEGG